MFRFANSAGAKNAPATERRPVRHDDPMNRQHPSAKTAPLPETVAGAMQMHGLYCADCAGDSRFMGFVERYRQSIEDSRRLQEDLGIPTICTACALRDETCCYDGVQLMYDRELLFINGLLGCPLDENAGLAGRCFFCGPAGCKLSAKHAYCHNYYCDEIKLALGPENMKLLRSTVGAELSCQWELERELSVWLKRREAGPQKD